MTPVQADRQGHGSGEEYLYHDGITLLEWSEKIESMLPDETIFISITINDDQSRNIDIEGGSDEYSSL